MGVSFKISKRGTRYKPKPVISDSIQFNDGPENALECSKFPPKIETKGKDEDAVGLTGSSTSSGRDHCSGEDEVSFILNLYPDGYSIVKALENDNGHHAAYQDGLKILHPYDRTSEGLFAAIESGRLPGRILDEISCKFVQGSITCEVRDYRKCSSDPGSNISSPSDPANITKVCLKMSLENVVKDIPLMADDSWTYGDLMEVESRILNALQPKLCLDPVPRLDRICRNPASLKINLGMGGMRKRRLRQIPEVTITSKPHGKKICIDRLVDSSRCGDLMSQHVQENVLAQGLANSRTMHDPSQGPVPPPVASPAGPDMQILYADNMNSSATAKLVSQEGQLSPYSTFNKRARLASVGPDGIQQQQVGSFVDGFQGSDVQWRNQMLQQHQSARAQYVNSGLQKYSQLVGEGVAAQDGVKVEKMDPGMVKTDMQMMEVEGNHVDPRGHQRFHHPLMKPALQQAGWNSLSQQVEKDHRKEDQFSKRKSIQSPRLSAGAVAHSPLSARSAEMCGSMGTHYGAVTSGAPFAQLQREKSGVTSVPAAGRASSVTSMGNDSMQHQHQTQLAAKRRSNSLPKTPAISGVGSPASVNNIGGLMNASSPSISTPQLTEQDMLERFAKIEMVAMRHKLNCKKNKADEFCRKPLAFSGQELLVRLAGAANNEYADDSREMSKSLVGGHMNVCKIRVVNVRPATQGNMLPVPVRTRMILSEKPTDGTVAMHYGDLDDGDFLNAEDHLPTLPNTHWADLLAAQFCALVLREGYVVDEVVQPRPPRLSAPANSHPNPSGGAPNNSTVDTQQYSESVAGQTMESKPAVSNTSLNSTGNVLPSSGIVPPGNSQSLKMSQGLVSGVTMPARPQQMGPQQSLQPQQQQSPLQNQPSLMQQVPQQFQQSPLMLPNNSMPQMNVYGQGSNLPMGNTMGNKSSLQMLQQPQQPQQQQQQRRMMMGLGTAMGMGNIGNNMGLGGLSNVMGIGGAKGIGGTGITGAMGPMSGMGQNPMGLSQANAISQHLRNGSLNPQALAAAQRIKMLQNRGLIGGTQLGGAQSGMAGMSPAARQMQPGSAGLSMLGQSLNRGNITQMQRTAMGQMGMPKLMQGMNVPLNQQQYLQQQHLQHQQHLQLQLQQQQQQQQQQLQQQQQQQQHQQQQHAQPQQMQPQEATSPLQAVLSPPQVSSPSTLGIPQQMNQQLTPQQQASPSPQQMGQRTPMSPPLSSGPMHPMSAGNPDVCPGSPALSSQTLGSVGSITNSPLDLQGVNKSSSATNT